jgi:DNA polymerase I-like protein with 3'-5' exonuclease and polymerase domains
MVDIIIDLETLDPDLKSKGSDAMARARGGYVFLAGLMWPSEFGLQEIMPWTDKAKSCIREHLDQGHTWWGANIKYDLCWLMSEGVMLPRHTYNNRFRDILIDAPLIDETQQPKFYSMNGQAAHYGLPLKPVDKLLTVAPKGVTEKNLFSNLHRLPIEAVAEYLQHDLTTTWAIAQKQAPLLEELGLQQVVELESRLIPVLTMMQMQGIRIDVEATKKLYDSITPYIENIQAELRAANGGVDVNLSASKSLEAFLQGRGHQLERTPKSTDIKPRFKTDSETLNHFALADPLIADILLARRADKIRSTFLQGLLDCQVNGRIYPSINQLVKYKEGSDDDSAGVRFGRLSYSQPNTQQIPKRDTVGFDDTGGLGSAMRSLFIAEEDCMFMSADFSSQEPRWIVHWTETWGLPGAKSAGDAYRDNPATDYHSLVASFAKVPRPMAKIINLGKGYEMGKTKLVRNLVAAGADPASADGIITQYDQNFPHVKAGSQIAKGVAERNGFVRTYSGRRLHFNLFEPVGERGVALPYDEAFQKFVMAGSRRQSIRRAFTYRAFNRIIQGSSADQTKAVMVALWYDHGILPTLQVHDELCFANLKDYRQAQLIKDIMENTIKLTIPSLTEVKVGRDWKHGIKINFGGDFSDTRS